MKKVFKLLGIAAIMAIVLFMMAACDDSEDNTSGVGDGGGGSDPGGGTGPVLLTDEELAKELAEGAYYCLRDLHYTLETGFSSPTTIDGSESGSVTLTGTKTYSRTGPGSGPWTTTEITEITQLILNNYSNASWHPRVTGTGTFYYKYYNYLTSSGGGRTTYTANYTLNSCQYNLVYLGNTYTGTVSISDFEFFRDTSSSSYGNNYTATVNLGPGKVFNVSGRLPS